MSRDVTFRTKGGYTARLNHNFLPWARTEFAYLGVIIECGVGWAWHRDGRSIDKDDRAFDLVDFPQSASLAETVAADG